MDWDNPTQRSAFFDLHTDNPREGPGDFQSAERAFVAAHKARGGEIDTILDLACGPGMQTRYLSQLAPKASITALDITPAYLTRLRSWCVDQGLENRITVQRGDMTALELEPGQQDLIWCEGAVYMMGVEVALAKWHRLLRPGGCVAFSEPVFLFDSSDQLPDAVVQNWKEYPAMTSLAGVEAVLRDTDYNLIDSFVFSEEAWIEYYDPLQIRVDRLRTKYADVPDAALVIEEGQAEINAWRNYGQYFSYAFFVVQA